MGIETFAKMNMADIIAASGTDPVIRERVFLLFRRPDQTIETVTYGAFYRKSLETANLIDQKRKARACGTDQRFHVGVFMQNIPEFFYLLGGCAFADATLVGINNAQVGEKLAFDINNVDMDLLFVDTARQPGTDGTFLDTVLAAGQAIGFRSLAKTDITLIGEQNQGEIPCLQQALDRCADSLKAFEPVPLQPENPAVVIFTSGTTGAPKGIEVSWKKLVDTGVSATAILNYTPADVGYVCMPVNHSNSLYLNVMPALMNQARIFLRRKFSVSGFVEDIEDAGATIWNCVGDPVQYLLNTFDRSGEKHDYRHLPLRTVISTGTNAANRERFTRLFGLDIFTEVYGSTEAGALTAVDAATPPYSVGQLLKDVRIIREETLEVCEPARMDGTGRIVNLGRCAGEIVVSQSSLGASAFGGYYKLPEESAKKLISLDGEVFYRMGDLGSVTEVGGERYLIFLGRTGDWIRYKGENWSPMDGIKLITRYPGVTNAGIIGVPQSKGREDDPMYVLQVEDYQGFDIRDFYTDCRKNLPHYMLPRFIRIMRELPMTETMKLKNSLLKKEFYYRNEALDQDPFDQIYTIQDHQIQDFHTPQYREMLALFSDSVNQDTLKAFTGRSDLFESKQ